MPSFLACVFGCVCGIVGSIPAAFLFERALHPTSETKVDVATGLLAILASFALLTTAIAVVHVVDKSLTLPFGGSAAGVFLVLWGIESIRGLRAACGKQI